MDRKLSVHRSEYAIALAAGNPIQSVEDIAVDYLKAHHGEVKLEEMVQAAYEKTKVNRIDLSNAISHRLKTMAKKGEVTHVRTCYWSYNH